MSEQMPNAELAIVDVSKLRDYCLNPDHPRGKHKARVFQSSLNLKQEDAEALKAEILAGVCNAPCVAAGVDEYGRRYVVDFSLHWLGQVATIRTSWIIKEGEDAPRLTSCYVK
tara:strand:- start:7009 stop:7347 length:339 start_codon:yes stop_codon:yes gene_type:complete